MIIIANVSKPIKENSKYVLKINNDVICYFEHKRSTGLAECLRRAADAVDKDKEQLVRKIIESVGKE